jgi:hypothetical protein
VSAVAWAPIVPEIRIKSVGRGLCCRPTALESKRGEKAIGVDRTRIVLLSMTIAAAAILAACGNGTTSACNPLLNFSNDSVIHCPQLSSILVRPEQSVIGGAVALSATTTDDVDASTTVFLWSAQSGTFADPSSLLTTFTCTAPGNVTITMTATRDACTQTLSASVDCIALDASAD